ncbi:MAG: TonB-dependent receptor [Thermoanaerobaculia bacterium]|nr:TonB-dependent receptor [Thermoanaerobaculia bacterium]
MKQRFQALRNATVYLTPLFLSTVLTLPPAVASESTTDTPPNESAPDQEDRHTVRAEITVTSSLPELATSLRIPGSDLTNGGSQDVVDHLRYIAGLDAVRRGTINLEPAIRGLQESQIAMFVDGTRTFAAGPARMDSDLSHVGPRSVQSLEVVKGPYALTWGSGTLSAIRLVTVRPDFSEPSSGLVWQGRLDAVWGENGDTADTYGSVSAATDRLRFHLGLGRRSGEEYEDGRGASVPGGYRSHDLRWRLGFRPSQNLTIDYSGGFQEQDDLDYPGRILDATYFDTRSHAFELRWAGRDRIEGFTAELYSNRKDHLMNNEGKPTASDMPGRIPPFGLRIDLPTESNTSGGRLRLDLASHGDTKFSFGLDQYRVEQTATRTISRRSNDLVIFTDQVWPDAVIQNLGGWAQVVTRRNRVRYGATVRADRVEASTGDVSDFFAANTVGASDQSETNLSAAVNAIVEAGKHWTLEFGLGRAVRSATVLERYSDRFPATKFQLAAEFMGNPLVDPETSLELDGGARARYGDLYLEVGGFYRRIDEYITVSPDPELPKRLPLSPPLVYRYVNGDRAIYFGGEVSIRHQTNDVVGWRASMSWVRAEDEELNEPVLGISPLRAELGLRLTPNDSWWIDGVVRWVDRQDRVAVSRFEQVTPGYEVFDIGAGLRTGKGVSLALFVDNVTDEAYASHLNSPNPFTRERISEPGRSFRLAFGWDF